MSDQRFAHMVYFTLKDSSTASCETLVAACKKYLSQHPGTDHFSAGVLSDTDREVVDKAYHVALHLVFTDRAAHDAYQVADDHNKFVEEQKENWENVRVFDSDIK